MKWFPFFKNNPFKRNRQNQNNSVEQAEKEDVVATGDMTAKEFAKTLGLQIRAFTDDEDDQLSASELSDLTRFPTQSSIASRCTVTSFECRKSPPKLDMTMFIPPEGISFPASALSPIPHSPVDMLSPLPRRATTGLTHVKGASENFQQKESANLSTLNAEFVSTQKKGRFIVTREQSSYYRPRRRTQTLSMTRFECIPDHHRSQSDVDRNRQKSLDSGISMSCLSL